MKNMDIQFRVDKEHRMVFCKLSNCRDIAFKRLVKYAPHLSACDLYYEDKLRIPNSFYGMAKCSPEDEWDEEKGKKVALAKAKRKRCKAVNKKIEYALKVMEREMHDLMKYAIHNVPSEYLN